MVVLINGENASVCDNTPFEVFPWKDLDLKDQSVLTLNPALQSQEEWGHPTSIPEHVGTRGVTGFGPK